MKKLIIVLTICISIAMIIVSCGSNKKCPAYSKRSSVQSESVSVR